MPSEEVKRKKIAEVVEALVDLAEIYLDDGAPRSAADALRRAIRILREDHRTRAIRTPAPPRSMQVRAREVIDTARDDGYLERKSAYTRLEDAIAIELYKVANQKNGSEHEQAIRSQR